MDADRTDGRPVLDDEVVDFAQRVFGDVRTGHVDVMRSLLAQGLPPNLRNHKRDSLLMLASYHGHAEVTRLLLEHGADTEITSWRSRPSETSARRTSSLGDRRPEAADVGSSRTIGKRLCSEPRVTRCRMFASNPRAVDRRRGSAAFGGLAR